MCAENLDLYNDNISNLKTNKERLENIISYVIKYKGGIFDGFKGQKQYYKTLEWITKQTTENTMYLLNSDCFKMEDYNEYALPLIKLIIRISFLIEGYNPGQKLPLNIYTIKDYYGINKSVIIGIELEKTKVIKSIIKTIHVTLNEDRDVASNLAKNTTKCLINHDSLKSRSVVKEVLSDNIAGITDTLLDGAKGVTKAVATEGTSLVTDIPKFALKTTKTTKNISTSIKDTKKSIKMAKVDNYIDFVFLAFDVVNFASKFSSNYKNLYPRNNISSKEIYGYENNTYGFIIKNNFDVSNQD